jgi:uncharacterized protein YpbB
MQMTAHVDIQEDEGQCEWTVLRKLELPEGSVSLVAVSDGNSWKVTAEGSDLFQGLEFFGPLPKLALDHAENFVRRLMRAPSVD